jgi:hypothetical protein
MHLSSRHNVLFFAEKTLRPGDGERWAAHDSFTVRLRLQSIDIVDCSDIRSHDRRNQNAMLGFSVKDNCGKYCKDPSCRWSYAIAGGVHCYDD